MQIIPLTSNPNQVVKTTVNVDGKNLQLQLTVRFNEHGKYWVMGIVDPTTQKPLVDSIPLLSADYPAANLLEQYGYLGIGSAYIVNVGNSDLDYPDEETLGGDFVLVWGDTV